MVSPPVWPPVWGVFHTLPFLIASVSLALRLAYLVDGVERMAISWIRYRFLRASFLLSCVQVILGGAGVFAVGVLIGD